MLIQFSEILNFLAKIDLKFLNFERLLTELRSEKFEWFGPSPIEPFNSGMLIVGNQMEAPKQAGMAGGDFAFLDRHNSLLVAESGRAKLGRAQLRALTFLEARYGAISAKMQTAGTLRVPSRYPPGTLPVPCTFRRGLIKKIRQNLGKI